MIYYAQQVQERLECAKRYHISLNDEMIVESIALLLGKIGEQLDGKN